MIGFKVHLDCVHAVNTLLVPWCLLLEQGSELLGKSLVFRPVLNEVRLHEFIVEDEHGEVEFALLVHGDGLLHDLRQVVLLLTQLNLVRSDDSVNLELLIFLALVDQLYLPHVLFLLLELRVCFCHEVFDFNSIWELFQRGATTFHTLVVLLDEEPGAAQEVVHLFILFYFQGLQTVVFAVAEVVSEQI